MLSVNSSNFPRGVPTASFTSPLMDCTSAIHNSDNIQKGAPCYITAKGAATLAAMGKGKGLTLAIEKPQTPVLPLQRTNNPYAGTSADGSPCVPRSQFSTETIFVMSYKEEEARRLTTVPSTSNEPSVVVTAAQNNTGVAQGHVNKTNLPPAPRNGTMTQSACWFPPFKADAAAAPTATRSNRTGAVSTPSSSRAATRRVEIWNARNNTSAHSTLASTWDAPATKTDSVTHVRCRRIYVNGRPMTVWLKEDEQ
ncbi:uncharacterized protein Tco025E_10074 [Trypanosoma conorhini]|uniref:Uncharacterized protein n=1 Tax=Trypanosoma conorhini TaxID=83891 RepID=A0A3R7M364_9TRYP|nr:uncharacterized protein Tco025E_10074 [Trypanosoma conorhini]RNE95300.1 hypothetical protein Tco025E_10074 [Trypanosoma conorhini]